AGSRSRKPTGSSALMAGAGRRWTPAAFSPGRIAVPLSPSTSPKYELAFKPAEQPLFGKDTAPVKGAVPHPAKFTTSPLRPQKLTPRNGHLLRSASRSDLNFTGRAARRDHERRSPQTPGRRLASAFTPTTRRPFRGRRV